MENVTVSVVICAYTEKRWDDLVAAIASVHQQTLPVKEIVLVIDHNEALLQKAREYFTAATDVTIVENLGPAGANGSRNAGIASTTGSILAFLDDDAVATPDWLAQLLIGFEDPEVLGVGGHIDPLWLHHRPAWFPDEFNWVLGCTYRGMPAHSANVRNLIGCNMALRREVWDSIGGFWHQFGHVGGEPRGCGDTEFGIRIHRRWPHHKLLYLPLAKVYHRVPANRMSWHYFISRCKFEGSSKARLAQVVGTRDGLSSERTYVLHTLPQGLVMGIVESVFQRDLSGLARSGAIAAGLASTVQGYMSEMIRSYGKLIGKKLQQKVPTLFFPFKNTKKTTSC
ncbi:MAG TPA: glycosyltransferase family 2 protein [Ktedonobacteraceae bacterium]